MRNACKAGVQDISPSIFELYLSLAQVAARLQSMCSASVIKDVRMMFNIFC